MNQVLKIALPGYNAETDTNPDHFSLYVDGLVDYILIKEKVRATVTVSGSVTIAHGLGYVPFCMAFVEYVSGGWQKLYSRGIDSSGFYFTVDSTNLTLYNTTGTPKKFSYYIFFDNIT